MIMEKERKTIALLVSGIMDQFTESLCRGAIKGSKREDVNLIVFPGKYIDRDLSGQPEIMYEYQYNTIFEYAKSHQLDGLIVSAGNIGCFAGDERVRQMLEGYGDVPIILVASKWDGYVSVNYDNESGVREGLEYLIDKMHCTRFAMLAGPDGNTDARERRDTFIKVMEEHNIPVTDKMFAYGNLNRENPEECNMLLDNNPDVEAIFCVNDDSALGLYDVMKQRGLMPGKDIKIFGYDNTIAGSKAQPSLSTVGSDAVYLGEQAVHTICSLLNGSEIESVVLSAKFIRRKSLGESYTEEETGAFTGDRDMDHYFDEIFYRYLNSEITDGSKLRAVFKNVAEELIRIMSNPDISGREKLEEQLMRDIDDLLDYNALEYADVDDLLQHIEHLYQSACAENPGLETHFGVRDVVDNIYRKIIHNMDFRAGRMRADRLADIDAMEVFVRNSLKFRKGNDSAYAAMLECMSWLNVQNAYVYAFEEPIAHLYKEKFNKPSHVYLKAYIHKSQIGSVTVNKQKLDVSCMFDNEYILSERSDFVLFPLFYNEEQYGLLLCDLAEKMYGNGEFLTNQLGAAVHMIDLLKENEKIQQRLEDMVVSLRENNIALDNLSKQDSLTGIRNRRGYSEEAEKLISDNLNMRKNTLVAYVDMNNLKIINDRYGHEEGDYSLKLISDVLSRITKGCGVVGRIGGDEYSFTITMEKEMDGSALERRIHAMFASHNEKSDKPYNVTVSIGFYLIRSDSAVGLEEALSYADEKLYIAKQSKVRSVEKNKE